MRGFVRTSRQIARTRAHARWNSLLPRSSNPRSDTLRWHRSKSGRRHVGADGKAVMIVDHENVARARLRIKALEGQAARIAPKKYVSKR